MGTLNQTLRTLREIDLKSVRQAAEAPFVISMVGESDDVRWLSALLSARPGQTGVHPWLEAWSGAEPVSMGTAGNGARQRLALLLTRTPELVAADRARLVAFIAGGVPVITVVIQTEAAQLLGADLPRSGELARAMLPAPGGQAPVDVTPLAAAMLQATGDRPGLRLALARQLPALRPALVNALIEDASRSNALYALSTGLAELTPGLSLAIGPADILMLTKNQLMLAFKVALSTGKQGGNRQLLSQVVGVIGSGLLFRQVAQELVGMIPLIGLVPKVAVAYAGTQVIGQTVWAWADTGRRLSRLELRRRYGRAMATAVDWARRILPSSSSALAHQDRAGASVTNGSSTSS